MKKFLSALAVSSLVLPCYAEEDKLKIELKSVFYGDNTEYLDNPHREGETLLGNYSKLYTDWPLSPKTHLYAGIFAHTRAGSEKAFDEVKPIITLTLGPEENRFVMGTLITQAHNKSSTPEYVGPHGMLPLLQKDQLVYERPYESGLQWLHEGKFETDLWINWQKLNTPEHREHFDMGTVSKVKIEDELFIGFQGHWVHSGGQLYSSGPVSDSLASAAGMVWQRISDKNDFSIETYGLLSRNMLDREIDDTKVNGYGIFTRLTKRRDDLRFHLIGAATTNFGDREGDPNYGILHDGYGYIGLDRFLQTYAETGLAKFFHPANGLDVEVSGRLMWTDGHFDYSYRVRATLDRIFELFKK